MDRTTRRFLATLTLGLACVLAGSSAQAQPPAPTGLAQLPDPNECVANDTPGELGDPACAPAQGLTRPTAGVVSPDGRNVYVPAATIVQPGDVPTGMIALFSRSTTAGPSQGALTQLAAPDNCLSRDADGPAGNPPDNPSCSGIYGPGNPGLAVGQIYDLAISPDGKNVYGASRSNGTLLIFNRTITEGADFGKLTYAGCASAGGANGCTIMAPGLVGASDVEVSPDGENVYVAGDGFGGAIASAVALKRDPQTGSLALANCIVENGSAMAGCAATGRGLVSLRSIAVSADSQTVYTGSYGSNAVAAFTRDMGSTPPGKLVQIAGPGGCVSETGFDHSGGASGACGDGRGLDGIYGLRVTPDGSQVLATGNDTDSLAILNREDSGALSQAADTTGCLSHDPDGAGGAPPSDPECGGARALADAGGVWVTPDGLSVYTVATLFSVSAVGLLSRDPLSGSLTQLPGADGCLDSPSVVSTCTDIQGIDAPQTIFGSADGRNVYVSTFLDRAVVELLRPEASAQPPPGDGGGDGTAAKAPVISDLRMTARRFAVSKRPTPTVARRVRRGSAFRYRLSRTASVAIAIHRVLPGRRVGGRCRKPRPGLRGRRCKRFRRAGQLRRANLAAGANRTAFSGRIGTRALRPGRYRATLTATSSDGKRSAPRRIGFRIVRARR